MIKTFITLIRGRNAEAIERVADANALTILDQQIRDATGDFERARRALAIAVAQEEAEGRRADGVRSRIADLENRATAALGGAARIWRSKRPKRSPGWRTICRAPPRRRRASPGNAASSGR